MSNTKLALILSNAHHDKYAGPTTTDVVVCVDGETIKLLVNGCSEIVISREDWQAIQEYIIAAGWDNQGGASDTSPTQDQSEDGYSIDWSAIPIEYGWVAVAQNGTAWAYGNKPDANCDAWWALNDPVTPIEINEPGIVIVPEGIDWRATLRQRPF